MRTVNPETAMYWPPEWALQDGVLLTWPHENSHWAPTLSAIEAVFIAVAREIVLQEKLLITCWDHAHQKHIEAALEKSGIDRASISFYHAPSHDIWVRDHGPVTVLHQQQPRLLDFIFNGWGHKYPADWDNAITKTIATQGAFKKTPIDAVNFVLEGGSIETDGRGVLLTTRRCLLAETRNPTHSLSDIENQLAAVLGIKKILWLDHGYLEGDDTDSHIDMLARFVNADTICYVRCTDPSDEHYEALQAMEAQLRTFANIEGETYRLVPLPWPKAHYSPAPARRLPLSYANFLIINGAVLVPVYDDPADAEALKIIADCFPDRKIVGINSLPVMQWNGGLHCMSMQLPQGVLL